MTEDASVYESSTKASESLDRYQKGFKPLHSSQKILMYFSVSLMHWCRCDTLVDSLQ